MRQGYTESLKRLLEWLRVPKMAGTRLVVIYQTEMRKKKRTMESITKSEDKSPPEGSRDVSQ